MSEICGRRDIIFTSDCGVMIMADVRKHAYWIHKKREDKNSVNGYIYLPGCKCSNCGYEANIEKPICPHCQAVMDAQEPEEQQ